MYVHIHIHAYSSIYLCVYTAQTFVEALQAVKTPYLQPRYYRAPEVILGIGRRGAEREKKGLGLGFRNLGFRV